MAQSGLGRDGERERGPTEEDNERNGAFSEKSAQQRAREREHGRPRRERAGERARGERLGRPNGRQASFSSRVGNLGETFQPRFKLRYFLGMI